MLSRVAATTQAIWYAYAAVAVAGESERRQLLAEALDTIEALQMADAVLGHGELPLINPGEEWPGAEANSEDLLQFVADDGDDGVVGELPDVFRARSGKETAQQARSSGAR